MNDYTWLLSPLVCILFLVFALAVMAKNSRKRRRPATQMPDLKQVRSRKPLVHSRATNLSYYIAPFEYMELETLCEHALAGGWILLQRGEQFLHFESRTALFGFADDVYFEFDRVSQQIYVCSASRIGKKDFGANRRRLEEFRKRLLAAQAVTHPSKRVDSRSGTERGENQ